jgi:benzylsuccinate CoA-transferase BbsF subunit
MAAELPLAGVRIADFSWVLAGPHCTKWLGALGAEVIKVESHYRPDRFRAVAPFVDNIPSVDSSVAFNMLNYSKRDCTINLGSEDGQRLAQQLVSSSHVIIENFSAGVAERLGLDYHELSRTNPALVMVSGSGLGRTGPDAQMRAFGKSIHAFAGHTRLTGWPGTPPRGIGGTWTDPVTGVTAVLAILAGLAYARRTGHGLYVELSMAEATMALMAEPFLEYLTSGVEPQPVGNHSTTCVPHNTYRCQDGTWVAITAHDAAEWRSLCRVAAPLSDLAVLETVEMRLPRRDAIDAALDAWCARQRRDEAVTALNGAGVCCAPVLGFDEMLADDHFRARELMMPLFNEGVGSYHIVKLPWQAVPPMDMRYTPTPRLGADNDYVFRQVLGLASEQITELTEANVLL